MEATVRTTIDGAGRVVIPRRIREHLGLTGGASVTITENNGRIEIEPSHIDVDLERKGSVTVFMPRGEVPTLDRDDVRTTVDSIRKE